MINLCWCFCFFPDSIIIQKYFTLNLVNVPIQIHGKMTASWWWIISIWCAIQMSLFLFSACCYSVDQIRSYMSACILFIEYFKEGFFFLSFWTILKEFLIFTFSLQLVLRCGILSWLQDWSYWFHHADTCYWRHGQILLNQQKQPISRYSTQFSDSISNLINYHLYHYLQKVI